ncbi:3'-5' exonuclease [Thalassotalea maritima]|uniref:3'-5' exonuclease n=1 Tax=Thalassotalea maritima TaxID=3242416 RepID=UPI003527FD4E
MDIDVYAKQWYCRYPTWRQTIEQLQTVKRKEDITKLTPYRLAQEQIVVVNDDNLNEAIDDICRYSILGFDSESRPNFKATDNFPISLLQIATSNRCYLFHIEALKSFSGLKSALENPTIIKFGIGLKSDTKALNQQQLSLINSVDLVSVFRALGRKKGAGAQHLTATLFDRYLRKSKRVALSNWANYPLTDAQCRYAAEDAMIALQCGLFLLALMRYYPDSHKALVMLLPS